MSWDRQSLADFEARPVTELAKGYDVMIVDHPELGAAIAAGAVQPLRHLVPREVLDERKATSFVPTWDSYVVGGQPWALPVDAATQVSVSRPDLIIAAPRAWAELPALAPRAPGGAVPGRAARVPHGAGHVRAGRVAAASRGGG